MGRPSEFTPERGAEICRRLVEGDSLRAICRADDMPNASTVFDWIHAHPDFAEQYAHAREMQADLAFDEIVEIADDGRNDWMEAHDGGIRLNKEAIQRSALRVETRKWRMAKMKPKKYGERLAVDHSGEVKIERPDFSQLSPVERDALKTLLLTAEMRNAKAADEDGSS